MKKKSTAKLIIESKLIYVLVFAMIFWVIAITSLRDNYATMTRLREEVVVADQNNGDVETALQNLRKHVYSHMNTNLSSGSNPIKPPIQLKGRYDRLMAAEQGRVKEINAQVASRGEQICTAQYPAAGFNAARVACVQAYVSQNAAKESSVAEDLYKFDFISPRWSPDKAGISIVAASILSVVFLVGLGVKLIQRHRL